MTDTSFGFSSSLNVDFTDATLSGVNFNDANVTGSNYTRTGLVGVEFWRTIARGTNLSSANVNLAVFGNTDLTGATGVPVNHAGATYNNATCPGGNATNTTCW